jgi:ribonuclease-3
MNARITIDTTLLQERIGYKFTKPDLLMQALTHRSHGKKNNERLEFLGDSVLNCIVAEILFEKFHTLDEGDLSRVRANLVKQQALYEIAQGLSLSDYLRLGEGELKSGGFRRPSILADTLEAIIAAIFIEAGFVEVRKVLRRLYSQILENVDPKTLGKDDKTLLQEYLQGHQLPLPVYSVIATTGVAHNQQFEVDCTVEHLNIHVSGSGASRRAAEQSAAKLALIAAQKLLPQNMGSNKKISSRKKKSLLEPSTGDEQMNLTLRG